MTSGGLRAPRLWYAQISMYEGCYTCTCTNNHIIIIIIIKTSFNSYCSFNYMSNFPVSTDKLAPSLTLWVKMIGGRLTCWLTGYSSSMTGTRETRPRNRTVCTRRSLKKRRRGKNTLMNSSANILSSGLRRRVITLKHSDT